MNTKIRIYISALIMALFACQIVLACAQDPTADIDTDYVVGMKVLFDASGSYDVDGNITKYEWSVDNGQNYFEGGKKLIYTFDESDVGTTQYIKLRVTDDDVGELTNIATCTLNLYYVYNITDTTGYYTTSRGYSLKSALDAASDGDEIWVSTGTFYPHPGTSRSDTFEIKSYSSDYDITLYGGFTGLETSVDQRDWQKNKTILSGDIDDQDGTLDEGNCYHVVTFSIDDDEEDNNNSILDGFVITQGYANGSENDEKCGAGIYSSKCCPTLNNCIIENNYAKYDGGGIACYSSSDYPQITNCVFKYNTGDYWGGAAYFDTMPPHIVNTCFEDNEGDGDGDAIIIIDIDRSYHAKLINCVFVNRNAEGYIITLSDANAKIYNSTFLTNNEYHLYIEEADGEVIVDIYNSVFWGSDYLYQSNGTVTVNENNIIYQQDPKYVNENLLEGPDGRYFTADDGLCVRMDSSCIDADVTGNSYLPDDIADIDGDDNTTEDLPLDIAGRTRIMDGNHEDDDSGAPVVYDTVDIGAYEMPKVWYVDENADDGDGTGKAWNKDATDYAFKYLQDALDDATDGDEIWVADGTYYPDEGDTPTPNDQTESFTPAAGVELYGGFTAAAAETARTDRDWVNNKTILSGDIDGDSVQNDDDNSEHVVFIPNSDSKIDGFTVEGGYGGSRGGGVCIRLSRDETGECLSNCVITNNQSEKGAGLYVRCVESALVENCYFYNNHTTYDGGAVYIDNDSKFDIKNCVFAQNQAKGYGGAIYSDESDYDIINCTFYGNQSNSDNSGGETGGAIYNYSCDPNIINSIFWADKAYLTANEIVNSTYAFPNIMFCDIQNATPCSQLGIINGDPKFISNDPDGTDNDFGTVDDGLRLSVANNSACVDAADGDLAPSRDIVNNVRIDILDVSGGAGIPDYADIGAYEGYSEKPDDNEDLFIGLCIIDESTPYHDPYEGYFEFHKDEVSYDEMLDLYSTKTINSICLVPPTDVTGEGYNQTIDDVLAPPNYDKPTNIEVEQCTRPPGRDELISFYLSISEYKYPDYVLISLDGSGSGDGDWDLNQLEKFEDWLEEFYPGVIVHTRVFPGIGAGPNEEWIEELELHIEGAINGYYD